MPPRDIGTYYNGRTIKLGTMDHEKIINAILHPQSISSGTHAWTIVHSYTGQSSDGRSYYFGKLCKYEPEGEVARLNSSNNSPETVAEPNLIEALSPFVYIPWHSGISFLRIPGQIEVDMFRNRFRGIVLRDPFFEDLQIEMITDLRPFVEKIRELDYIDHLTVKVHPPNPLFGDAWGDLKDYLQGRSLSELKLDEQSKDSTGIRTRIVTYIDRILGGERVNETIPYSDAAILMAADGYGDGMIHGKKADLFVSIKTSTTIRNFDLAKDPTPEQLFTRSLELFDEIADERYMEH